MTLKEVREAAATEIKRLVDTGSFEVLSKEKIRLGEDVLSITDVTYKYLKTTVYLCIPVDLSAEQSKAIKDSYPDAELKELLRKKEELEKEISQLTK